MTPLMLRPDVAVVGVGATCADRGSGRTAQDVALEAVGAALLDADLDARDIDACFGTPTSPNPGPHLDGFDECSSRSLMRVLGRRDVVVLDSIAMVGTALLEAAIRVHSGLARYAVVVRAVSDIGANSSPPGSGLSAGEMQFTQPFGLGPGAARHALWWQRYMYDWNATREDLCGVVCAGRDHAVLNELAYWRNRPLTASDYLSSRWVCEPLCLFDCDMPVAAASAFVVTTSTLAASHRHRAYIDLIAEGVNPEAALDARLVQAGAVTSAQLYDGFSPFVLLWLERLGFARPGQAPSLVREGRLRLGGDHPTNTFGGSLGEGRSHGAGHIREAVLQTMGRAGARQVARTELSLALVGIPETAVLMLFSADPHKGHVYP